MCGIKFTVVTDCQALLYLNRSRSTNAQTARWAILLQEFEITYCHRAGERMQHVDALSRAPVESADESLESEAVERASVFVITEVEQVAAFQEEDDQIKLIKNALINYAQTGDLPDARQIDHNEFRRYELNDNILYRIPDKLCQRKRFVLPRSMRKAMCIKYHDNMGHYSADKVVQKIAEKYWFPGMRRYVRQHVKRCIDCIVHKGHSGKEAGKLHSMEPDKHPFQTVQIDHVGPFVKTLDGNTHVLVIEDNFSRYTELYPVLSTSVKCALEKLKEFMGK